MRPTGHIRERTPGSWESHYSLGPASGAPPRPPPRGEKRAPATNAGRQAAYKAETPKSSVHLSPTSSASQSKNVLGQQSANRNSYRLIARAG
jgi:hypothetical protein